MSVYGKDGTELSAVYDKSGVSLSQCYAKDGTVIPLSGGGGGGTDDDYNEYYSDYQHEVLIARDAWKTQYRADQNIIPIILHTDEHALCTSSNQFSRTLFTYLDLAIKWNEISACIGLGDFDMYYSDYQGTFNLLARIPANKQINIWGNHDLWNFTDESGEQYVTDWDTFHFDNSDYGDVSYEYDKKGNEYHIDEAHNVKYVCIAGWELDKAKGGHSHYCITSDSMESIIDMLEGTDGNDIVILSHCCVAGEGEIGNRYNLGINDDDTFRDPPTVTVGGRITDRVADVSLVQMLVDRKNHTSGTITDSYGNSHSYDFSNTTGDVLCCFNGHGHWDAYGYTATGGIPVIMFDAYAYGKNPFYFINIDRTNETITEWKVLNDANNTICSHVIPIVEPQAAE